MAPPTGAPPNCRATLYKFLIYANEALSHYFTFATRRPTNAVAAPSHSAPRSSSSSPSLLLLIHQSTPPNFEFSAATQNVEYIYILCKKRASRSQKMSQCFFHLIFSEQTTTTARDTSLPPPPSNGNCRPKPFSERERETPPLCAPFNGNGNGSSGSSAQKRLRFARFYVQNGSMYYIKAVLCPYTEGVAFAFPSASFPSSSCAAY